MKKASCSDFGGRNNAGDPCTRTAGWGTGTKDGPCKDHVAQVENVGRQRHQTAFLAALRRTGNLSAAARAANIDRGSHYVWLEHDASYKSRYEDAKSESIEVLEAEARRRAIAGLKKFKFTKNGKAILHPVTKEPYVEHTYSDALLIFLLKAEAPDKYRERFEHSGPGGGPIVTRAETDLTGKSLPELIAMREAALRASAGAE